MDNIISPENDKNNKKFWSYIKSQRKDNSGVAQLLDKNGTLSNDNKAADNILNEQFSSVFNKKKIPSRYQTRDPALTQQCQISV